jgi:hypothetical protein
VALRGHTPGSHTSVSGQQDTVTQWCPSAQRVSLRSRLTLRWHAGSHPGDGTLARIPTLSCARHAAHTCWHLRFLGCSRQDHLAGDAWLTGHLIQRGPPGRRRPLGSGRREQHRQTTAPGQAQRDIRRDPSFPWLPCVQYPSSSSSPVPRHCLLAPPCLCLPWHPVRLSLMLS